MMQHGAVWLSKIREFLIHLIVLRMPNFMIMKIFISCMPLIADKIMNVSLEIYQETDAN